VHLSEGCADVLPHPWGLETKLLEVFEPALGSSTVREYVVDMPARTPTLDRPAPLLLWFHGQFNRADNEARYNKDGYRECAHANGYITVYPQGLDDFVSGVSNINGMPSNGGRADMGTGWNIGAAADETVCLKQSQVQPGGPLPHVVPSEYSCYKSCIDRNMCGKCSFSTCHDDLAFVKALLTQVSKDYCVDLTRIYAAGGSAGGMMAHYLSQSMADTFAGFSTIYALPFAQYAQGRNAELIRHRGKIRESGIIAFHGLNDTTIPHIGGLSMDAGWQWYYSSLDELMALWAGIHECAPNAVQIAMPVSIPAMVHYVRCYEHKYCSTGKRVIKCLYYGEDGIGKHGTVPRGGVAGSTALWFMNQLRRNTPASWLSEYRVKLLATHKASWIPLTSTMA